VAAMLLSLQDDASPTSPSSQVAECSKLDRFWFDGLCSPKNLKENSSF